MREKDFRALVRLELVRIAASTRAAFITLAAGGLGLIVLDAVRATSAAFLFLVVGVTVAMGPLMSALRDKLDGGLEFLTALPVSAGTAAASRLAGCAVGAFLATPFTTASAALMLPGGIGRAPDPALLASVSVALWVGTAASAASAVAAILRFDQRRLSAAPVVGLVAMMALGPALDRVAPDLGSGLEDVARQPWLGAALVCAVCAGGLVSFWIAFGFARQGLARFRPGRDRLTW